MTISGAPVDGVRGLNFANKPMSDEEFLKLVESMPGETPVSKAKKLSTGDEGGASNTGPAPANTVQELREQGRGIFNLGDTITPATLAAMVEQNQSDLNNARRALEQKPTISSDGVRPDFDVTKDKPINKAEADAWLNWLHNGGGR